MLYDELTYQQRKKICFTLTVNEPAIIHIQVYDKRMPNSYYINREIEMPKAGESVGIELLFPLTPDILTLDITTKGQVDTGYELSRTYDISEYSAKDFHPTGVFMTGKQRKFIEFAKEFSQFAGIKEAGKWSCEKDDDFVILYLDNLVNADGSSDPTPARINKETGVIEINHFIFRTYSVPIRMFILCHEFSHFFMNFNAESEEEADAHALDLYLGLGFPHVEAVYALTNILPDTPETRKRVERLQQKIESSATFKKR